MLDYSSPQDFVLSTGVTHSIRDFVNMVTSYLDIEIEWSGVGLHEVGVNKLTGQTLVIIDPKFYRPCEVDLLIGSSNKAEALLNWKREFNLMSLIVDMVDSQICFSKS